MEVVVIGARIAGLSVAFQVTKCLPFINVTVVAETFGFSTTSFNCGGLWKPYHVGDTSPALVSRWVQVSLRHFMEVYHGEDAAGVQQITGYQLCRDPGCEVPHWHNICLSFATLNETNLRIMGIPKNF